MRIETVNRYLSTEINSIKGWCIPQLWQSIWPLYKAIGDGPICEIGVFEGKFFIGLAKTFGPDIEHEAIDIFELQRFNLDKAGVGKKDIFLENAQRLNMSKNNINCWTRDSSTLKSDDARTLNSKYGGFNFFSVDGCHEVLHTYRDINFAMSVTKPEGIIAVDDYMNPNWPGVMEAVAKMYLLGEYQFVPLLYTCNKLFLCSVSYHEEYFDLVKNYIKSEFENTRVKEVTRFGYSTLTVIPDLKQWVNLV